MGKSSMGRQIPTSAGAVTGSEEGDNNSSNLLSNGPPVLPTAMAAAGVASASRDVFQGLFLDLGKQAMAMEAVLRLICGKVDSMEAWMTEISFGMTELDLKLRNIAHNIEGTAANVDDEAANAHRWAAPPPQDDRAAHMAATVKKKIGPSKKGLKVTGMVASIIDTLGSPAEERDKAAFSPASAASSVAAAAHKKKSSVVVSAAKKAHNKKKSQQPKPDKPQSRETPSDASGADRASGEEEKEVAEEISTAADEEADIKEAATLQVGESEGLPSVPALPEHTREEGGESTRDGRAADHGDDTGRSVGSDRSANDASRGAGTDRSVDFEQPGPAIEEKIVMRAVEKEEARGVETVIESEPMQVAGKIADVRESPAIEKAMSENQMLAKAQEHTSNADSVTTQPASPTPDPVSQDVNDEQQQTSHTQAALPATEVADTTSAENQNTRPVPQKHEAASESSGYLPPPPQETKVVAAFHLLSPAPSVSATSSASLPSTAALESAEAGSSAPVPAKLVKESSSKKKRTTDGDPLTSLDSAPFKKTNSRKAMSSSQEGAVAAATLLRKASSHRKSQMIARKSKSSVVATPTEEAGVAESSRQVGGGTQILAQTTLIADEASELVENEASAQEEDRERMQEQDAGVSDDSDEDSEVSSDEESSSDDDPGSSSGSENQDAKNEEEDAGNDDTSSAKDAMHKASKLPGTMTRTITALKKLKKANMLTTEEEEELKQRAQEKWFKLKGHIKEKKKKDVANILLKRKKNVFTVSARIELLEEKSKEVYASIKQLNSDLKTKADISANDTLRRQVYDINLSLQALDHRLTHGATPAMERVVQLSKEVELIRSSFSQQLVLVSDGIAATKLKLANSDDEHRKQLEFLTQSFEHKVATLVQEHDAKLQSLPDYSLAIEGVKRGLRRKADLKLLKELEVRLLGHDVESEDCLVRCLSCHKEVVSSDADITNDGAEESGERSAYLKKVNPGPSSGKIYRSNVPFSAQLMGAFDSILEDAAQASGDAHFSERPRTSDASAAATASPVPKQVVVRREEVKASGGAAPISLIQIKASRAAMSSPDRPISAPAAAALKKRTPYLKSKERQQTAPPKQS